jgi:hypothetical protein|tara:strand:+ start:988 stop:1248 length:261 start_codon:yes stop_codon:yes gene_type:complete
MKLHITKELQIEDRYVDMDVIDRFDIIHIRVGKMIHIDKQVVTLEEGQMNQFIGWALCDVETKIRYYFGDGTHEQDVKDNVMRLWI